MEFEGTKYSIENPADPTFPELMEVYLIPLLKTIYSEKSVEEYLNG